MKTDKDAYLIELQKEIARLKDSGKKCLYRINDNVSENVISYVKAHFAKLPGYTLDIKKCWRCKNTWDIIITFVN
jgi:hypothetical protein